MTHKVEAASLSTVFVNFYQITQYHISEDCILHSHYYENVRSDNFLGVCT